MRGNFALSFVPEIPQHDYLLFPRSQLIDYRAQHHFIYDIVGVVVGTDLVQQTL